MRKTVGYAIVGATGVVLAGALAFGVVAPVRITGGSPAANSYLAAPQLQAEVHYSGWARDVEGRLDGRTLPVQLDVASHTARFQVGHLAEGPHDYKVIFHQAFVLRDQEWAGHVVVQSHPPQLKLESPPEGTATRDATVQFTGRADPDTILQVADQPPVDAGPTGRFTLSVHLTEGDNAVVVRGRNRAGVEKSLTRHVVCDLTPPTISNAWPADGQKLKDDRPILKAGVADEGSGLHQVTVAVDDHPPTVVWKEDGSAMPTHHADIRYKPSELAEGIRTLHLTAEDRVGWKTEQTVKFLVDSTDTFGEKSMTFGAVGPAVAQLQKHLVHQGYLEGDQVTSTFDDATLAAVKNFQEEHHLKADGVVGPASIDLLSPHIVVDLARFSLVLLEGETEIKRYTVACGQPAYPTPTGEFRVAEMVMNPPWIPPKGSLWAREAKTIPPGPGNPLGTRWIGLNSDVVGIHGTNADYTIGTASSHGCMRMHISDVEDLYRRVNVGMRVTILRGTEKSPLLDQLWPH